VEPQGYEAQVEEPDMPKLKAHKDVGREHVVTKEKQFRI